MTEREQAIAQISDYSRNSLRGEWQQEQLPVSSKPIFIIGRIGDQERGKLSASLVIRRRVNEETGNYEEGTRGVNLGVIVVRKGYRRQGLEKAMLAELESQAEIFGAGRISGKVSDTEERETPGLLDLYRDSGFTVNETCDGWHIIKVLDSRVLH